MIEAYKDDSSVSKQEITQMIKDFDAFNVSGITLENSFNECFTRCEDILADLNEILFLISKKRKFNVYPKITSFVSSLSQIKLKFQVLLHLLHFLIRWNESNFYYHKCQYILR